MPMKAINRWPITLKSVPWRLEEFCYNISLQRSYSGTCTILKETINRFLWPIILFLNSETHQSNLKNVIKLSRSLW